MSAMEAEEEEEKKQFEEVVEHVKEVVMVEESARVEKRISLRIGSEGEEVRQMQVHFRFFYFFFSIYILFIMFINDI